MRKYYFCDIGIRNALIRNLNGLELRNDSGALWENFMIMERRKRNTFLSFFPESFFWRSYTKQEIDLIEESDGKRNGFELKFTKMVFQRRRETHLPQKSKETLFRL